MSSWASLLHTTCMRMTRMCLIIYLCLTFNRCVVVQCFDVHSTCIINLITGWLTPKMLNHNIWLIIQNFIEIIWVGSIIGEFLVYIFTICISYICRGRARNSRQLPQSEMHLSLLLPGYQTMGTNPLNHSSDESRTLLSITKVEQWMTDCRPTTHGQYLLLVHVFQEDILVSA